jgi:flavin reductase (DIM6/NTAB) family NADH-FMN oxidoreductase RutF
VPVTSEQFRDALRLFPAGVSVVTIRAGRDLHGLTVSSFASVSPEPPLVAVVIDHRHKAHELLQRPGGASFAVNILADDQVELSNRFAWMKDEDRFEEGLWTDGPTGAPILPTALAWLACTLVSHQEAGTHTVYVGEVQATSTANAGERKPLLYWNRGYRHLR